MTEHKDFLDKFGDLLESHQTGIWFTAILLLFFLLTVTSQVLLWWLR